MVIIDVKKWRHTSDIDEKSSIQNFSLLEISKIMLIRLIK